MFQTAHDPTLTLQQFSYLMLAAMVIMWGVFGTFSVRWCSSLVNGVCFIRRPSGPKPFVPTTEQITRSTMVSDVARKSHPAQALSPDQLARCREWNEYEQGLIFVPSFATCFGIVLLNTLLFVLATGGVWWYSAKLTATGAPLIALQVAGLVLGWFLVGPCAIVVVNRHLLDTSWLKALGVSVTYLATCIFLTLIVLVGLQVATDIWR